MSSVSAASAVKRPAMINDKAAPAPIKIVSYNMLNHKIERGDVRVDLDGAPIYNEEYNAARLEARVALVNGWMDQGHIVFLQEVPWEFASHAGLNAEIEAKGYAAAFKLYNFRKVPEKEAKKKNDVESTLGLMTLIPSAFEFKDSVLLMAFAYKHFSPEEEESMRVLKEEMAQLKAELEVMKKDADQKKNCPAVNQKIAEKAGLVKGIEASVKMPDFSDRPVLVTLVKKHRGGEVCLVNMHMPCQYEAPAVELQNAKDVRREVKQYMLDHAPSTPLIFGGDINCAPGGAAFDALCGKEQKDEWKAVFPPGVEYATTYGLSTRRFKECAEQGIPVAPQPHDLDHFLVLGAVTVLGCKKPTVAEVKAKYGNAPIPQLPEQPSDHFAVELDIEWPPARA